MASSAAVEQLAAAVEAVAKLDVHELPDALLVGDLGVLLELETQLRAVQARWLAVADARDATVAECGRTSRSWLVEEQLVSPGEASRRMRLARHLPAFPATEAAFAAADISAEHAGTIVAALATVPADVRDLAEAALLELAREHPPFVVARAVDRILATVGVGPDSDEAHARRYSQRGVWLDETFGGTGSLAGTLTAEALETVRVALRAAAEPAGPDDDRTTSQRMHDGLVDIATFYLGHADLGDVAGERPRVVVTMALDTLLERVNDRWATLDSGVTIAPETARRLACDAEILPAVLGARGEVLDLGVATRTWNLAIRRAAKLRDGAQCGYPQCRRPIAELHHIVWWSRGGTTCLDNAAWLCSFHHWLVHEGGWTLRRNASGGYTFTAPDGGERSSPPPRHPGAA